MNYQYQYPLAFWLLLALPLLALIFAGYRLWRKKAMRRIGDPALVKSMTGNHAPGKSMVKFCLLLLAIALGCLALSNPRRPDESSEGARKGIDIVVALDVSNSMLATDIAPDRLSRAKQFVSKLLDNLQDDRTGLVVFAGNAYAQMPLTFDKEAARMYVSTANPKDIPTQGTSIGDALKKSLLIMGDQTERFRSVILITDGETHDEEALEDARKLGLKGVMINTVGIGSAEGTTLVDSTGNARTDASGQVVISKLNEQMLQQIAGATNGRYIHLQSSDEAVGQLLDQFSQIDKKALGDVSLMNYKTYYAWLTIPMLLLMVVEVFLPDRKKIRS